MTRKVGMAAPIVLIVAPQEDIHADAVEAVLTRWGIGVFRVDTRDFPGSLDLVLEWPTVDNSAITLANGTRVRKRDILAVWWRRPQGYLIDEAVGGGKYHDYCQINSAQAFEAFVCAVSGRVVNDLWMGRRAERKGLQLDVAEKCGLPIPFTVITNLSCEVKQALINHCKMVYKSLDKITGASSVTKMLEKADVLRLEKLRYAPTIFQEYIEPGYDLRVYVIGAQLFAAKVISNEPRAKIDIRLDPGARITPYKLPSALERCLFKLMGELGLVFGAIDMKVDRDGNYYFLEVNPAGQWVYIEMETGQPITETLSAYLAGRSPERSRSKVGRRSP
jgi:hypothetical protein